MFHTSYLFRNSLKDRNALTFDVSIHYVKNPTNCFQLNCRRTKDIIAADLGMIYDTDFKGIVLSMSMRNFGPDIQYQLNSFEIPLIFKVGVSTTLQELIGFQSDIHSVNLFIDAVHPNNWSERIYVGGEYCFQKILFLRAGYKFTHSAEGFTLGFGVKVPAVIGRLAVDYAYKSTNDSGFEGVHVVSLSGSW